MKFSEYQRSFTRFNQDQQLIYTCLASGVSIETMETMLPNVKQYQLNNVSVEGLFFGELSDDTAQRIADGVVTFAGKLLKILVKISVTLWKKLIEFGKQLGKFLNIAKKRGVKLLNELKLSSNESFKIITLVKQRCDELIQQGVMQDMQLTRYVELIVESTGVKNKPLDEQNPASIRQWLETITPSMSVKRLPNLTYTIPEKQWRFYAYNQSQDIMSVQFIQTQKELSNYYLKLAQYGKMYLTSTILLQIINEKLKNKQHVHPTIIQEEILDRLIEPFFQFEAPYFSGNITSEKRLQLSETRPRELYTKSNDKLKGFESAMLSFLPTIQEGNPAEYITYRTFETNIDKMANYLTEVTKTINTIDTNRYHIFGETTEEYRSDLLNNVLIAKMIRTLTTDKDPQREQVARAIMKIIETIDRVVTQYHVFFNQLSMIQLKGLDQAQTNLKWFMPII